MRPSGIVWTCRRCGGADVLRTAEVRWDVRSQKWVFDSFVDEYDWCNRCADRVETDETALELHELGKV